jgi:hypothetical protein
LLAALLLFKRLLILQTLLAKLGLARAMCWLAADSLLVSIAPRPAYATQRLAWLASHYVRRHLIMWQWLNFQLLSYSRVTSLKAVKIMGASDYAKVSHR